MNDPGSARADRPLKALLPDAAYQLLYFAVMGGILVAWH